MRTSAQSTLHQCGMAHYLYVMEGSSEQILNEGRDGNPSRERVLPSVVK